MSPRVRAALPPIARRDQTRVAMPDRTTRGRGTESCKSPSKRLWLRHSCLSPWARLARFATWRRHSCLQRRDSSRRFSGVHQIRGQREWFSTLLRRHTPRHSVSRLAPMSIFAGPQGLNYHGMTVKRGKPDAGLDFLDTRVISALPRSSFFPLP